MGLLIVALLALGCAVIIGYPLFAARGKPAQEPALTDSDIDLAVDQLRQARGASGLHRPQCAREYQAGDGFCVGCGAQLPQMEVASAGSTCPQCGTMVQEGDQFCAKCGHSMVLEEVA
jgi:hypothetical protein